MLEAKKLTRYVIWSSIIGMGIFCWIYDEIVPNGNILGPLFLAYGVWRVYMVYVSER